MQAFTKGLSLSHLLPIVRTFCRSLNNKACDSGLNWLESRPLFGLSSSEPLV